MKALVGVAMSSDDSIRADTIATAPCDSSVVDLRAFGVHAIAERRLEKGRHIYSVGEIATTMALLVEGFAFKFAMVGEARQILHFFVPGDIIDQDNVVISNAPILFSTQALTDVRVFEFDADAYRALMKGDAHARYFIKSRLQQRQILWAKHMVDLARLTASERLASFIVEIRERLGLDDGAPNFSFPFHQKDLADALGLTVEHVNRTLKGMSGLCMVDWKCANIRILNATALNALPTGPRFRTQR